MKIVILDDNDELAKSLSLFFQLHGHDCMTVDNPVNALSYVNTFEPDVLISEFEQDDEDYLTLFELIRQQKKNTKIIILTSCNCKLSEQKQLLDLDISTILKKPVTPDYLLEIVGHFEKKYFLNFLNVR